MDKMIAYCGLVCTDCPAFVATQKDDDSERERVAETWSKEYQADVKPEDINCDGCLSENGRHFSYCSVCEIRKCGRDRGVMNCAFCDEYACEKLTGFFGMAPEARLTLDEIRERL
jgi:hypothetical protein